MDAIDTTSTDLVIIDGNLDNTDSFGKELAKTFAVSTATSAAVFGGFVAVALLTPKVKSWFAKKNQVDMEVLEHIETSSDKN